MDDNKTEKKIYTLKEIAKELNVSRATIDRVIYDRGGISEETAKRVRNFLKEVDYKPNKVGRSLAKRYNKNIYVVFHDNENEFFEDVKQGVMAAQSEIEDFGFSVKIIGVNKNSEEQLQIIKEASESGADAIAISAYEPDKFIDIIDELVKKNIPVVTFNNDVVNSTRLSYIGTNYYKSGRLAGEVMVKHCKQGKVAILSNRNNYWQNQQRITGFRDVTDFYRGIEIVGPLKTFTDFNSSYKSMKELMESVNSLKGVFILDNYDGIISGVCEAVKENNSNKIDVLTLDLNSECERELKSGNVTATICQDPFSQGYHSVKILFQLLFDGIQPKASSFITRLDVIYKENLDNYDNRKSIIRL